MQEHINRYQIIEKIGEGVGCSVYKAFDPAVNRYLAIKVLHGSSKNPLALEQFLKQTRIIGKLTHPGIAAIYDIGEDQGRAYIVLELLSGEFLDDVMISGRHFNWEEVVDIGTQIASALQYAHKQGVIHADLRPGNIAWFAADKRVVLTDFSHALRDYVVDEPTVQAMAEPSKAAYMSPEQVLGTRLDARSDLFSLGTLLYQLLTGHRPFGADTLSGLTEQITKQQPKPLRTERSDIHDRLIKVIEHLLEKDPESRYQNCDELLADFAKVSRALTVESSRNDARGGRGKLLGGLAVGVIVLVAIVYFSMSRPPIEPVALGKPTATVKIEQPTNAPSTETTNESPLLKTIYQQLAQFQCAAISVRLDSEQHAVVSGHVAQEDDMVRLMDIMEGVTQLRGVTYEVKHLVWPHCEVAAIFSPEKHANVQHSEQLKIKLHQPVLANKLFSGEFQNADVESFIYVDFYSKEGGVIHLYPQLGKAQQIVPAGASLRVEYDLSNSGIALGDDAMFVLISSAQPLTLDVTRQREPAQEYLSRLYRSVVVDKSPVLATYEVTSLAE